MNVCRSFMNCPGYGRCWASLCVAAAALIARASQKRLGKKTAVLIGIAAFALAVVVVILLARTAMPL